MKELPKEIAELLAIPYNAMTPHAQKKVLFLVLELLPKSPWFEVTVKNAMKETMERGITPAKMMQFTDFTELEKLDITTPIEQPIYGQHQNTNKLS